MNFPAENAAIRGEPDFSDSRLWRVLQHCPLCESERIAERLKAPDPHYGNPGIFTIFGCAVCGIDFMNPMPTEAYLATAYPTEYYSFNLALPVTRKQRFLKKLKRFFRHALYFHSNETGDPKFRTPGRMLDIGCGNGVFLAQMRQQGWQVQGVEPDAAAARAGREGLNLDIFAGTLEQAAFPAASFDYVRSNHSFEHVGNPREVLHEVRRILKPDGKLFIGVPNVRGMAARFWGPYWWYLGAPVHTFGFTPQSLSRLLEAEGFHVEKVRYNSTFAGIFGSLQIYLNRGTGRGSEEGRVVRNPILMVPGHWAAKVTDFLHDGDCIEIVARPA